MFALGRPLPPLVQRQASYEDEEFRIAELDRCELERQAVSLGIPAFDELFDANQANAAADLACIGNDGIAELVARNPRRFIGVATLPLVSIESLDAGFAELERIAGIREFKAVQIYTRVGGRGIDDPSLDRLWAFVTAHDMPVLLHPTGGTDNPLARDYMLWLTFGWPYDTSLAMLRLVYAGVIERFPTLRILTHHLGAYVPFVAERIRGVNRRLESMGQGTGDDALVRSLKGFYADTAVNGYRPALQTGYSFFGADHLLFGTDYPYVPIVPQRDAVLEWELPRAELAKIRNENAERFFKLG
jgi:aminocarboxymuconate-semialdehyde decarboxylase